MAMIVYGWGNVLKKKQFMGYQYCASCCDFMPAYLAKVVFRIHICYIPIFMLTKGHYICCGTCERGKEISKLEYKMLKFNYKAMTKSQGKKAFTELCKLCDSLPNYSPENVEYVYGQIASSYPISANEVLQNHYRELITARLQVMEALRAQRAGAAIQQPAAPKALQTGEEWTCPNCGSKNKAKFCSSCGQAKPAPTMDEVQIPQTAQPTQQQQPAQTAPVTVCPRCGKEDSSAPFFCMACGAPMNKPQ